jgi:hypothetical protein
MKLNYQEYLKKDDDGKVYADIIYIYDTLYIKYIKYQMLSIFELPESIIQDYKKDYDDYKKKLTDNNIHFNSTESSKVRSQLLHLLDNINTLFCSSI